MSNSEKILMEIHAQVLHLPHLRSSIESQNKLLEELVGVREEMKGVNDSVRDLTQTLKIMGQGLLTTIKASFGSMILAGCIVIIVAVVAITRMDFSGKGAGFEATMGQKK
jgi:ABC-type amino acid transport system permease subunit